MGRFWKRRHDPYRAEIERLVLECAPDARIIWDGPRLRVEGVERSAFDEVGQRLWDYRNNLVHNSQGTGVSAEALFALANPMTLIEPEVLELERRDRTLNRAAARVAIVFDFIELLVPKRLADEEIGDALERIARLAREGRPKWQIYVKGASAVFFVLLNWLREVTSSLLGKKNKA